MGPGSSNVSWLFVSGCLLWLSSWMFKGFHKMLLQRHLAPTMSFVKQSSNCCSSEGFLNASRQRSLCVCTGLVSRWEKKGYLQVSKWAVHRYLQFLFLLWVLKELLEYSRTWPPQGKTSNWMPLENMQPEGWVSNQLYPACLGCHWKEQSSLCPFIPPLPLFIICPFLSLIPALVPWWLCSWLD